MEGESKKRKLEEDEGEGGGGKDNVEEERHLQAPVKRRREEEGEGRHEGGEDHAGDQDEDKRMERAQQKGKKKARAPSGKFQQTFSEDSEFGSTDFKGAERLDAEEEAKGEASLVEIGEGSYNIKGVGEVEIEPFNLSGEREEGDFDDKGNYVYRRKDPNRERGLGEEEESDEENSNLDEEQADAWMQDINTFATSKRVTFAPDVVDNEKVVEKIDLLALKKEACKHILPGETVSKALIRLGNSMRAQKAAARKAKGKNAGKGKGVEAAAPTTTEEKKGEGEEGELTDAKRFELLTEAASKLMDEGWTNIYQYTLDQLKRAIKHEEAKERGEGEEKQQQQKEATMWEYKTGPNEEQVFGTFPSAAMGEWRSLGYLAGSVVRKVGDTAFVPMSDADFSV